MSPRTEGPRPGPEAALAAVAAALRDSGRPGMVIGGMAAIAHGVPRVTRDIDLAVAGTGTDLAVLLRVFGKHGIVPRIERSIEFAGRSNVLLLRHGPSGIEVDLSLAWLPFEEEAIAAALEVSLAGATVPMVRPEDLVVYKAVAWRPQDRGDVERLLAVHGAEMNVDRLRRLVADIAEALEEPERVEEFEALLERTLG